MVSNPECQKYYEEKYARIGLIHPLIMAAEFLPRPLQRAPVNDWQRLLDLAELHQWQLSADWQSAVLKPTTALIITDCQQRIAWTNRGFSQMTGYSLAQVRGRNPKLLQGEKTSPAVKQQIRQHLQQRLSYEGTLLNYRRDRQPYWCRVGIHPLYNPVGQVVHFIAIENEVKIPLSKP